MQTTITADATWLQSIEVLKDVPLPQLQWLVENSQHYTLPEGDYLFQSGDLVAGTHILRAGKIRIYMMQGREMREISTMMPKDISGALPFSRGATASVNARVLEAADVMTLPVEKFREMTGHHYELTEALVHVMTNRVRSFTSMQQQNEKMMALGKLSAGLAHELNNPAAAIVRGSESLWKHLQLQPDLFKEVMEIQMESKEVDVIKTKLFEVLERTEKPKLTLMQKTELEDELRDWFDENNVANSDEIAENFLEYGFNCEDLEHFDQHIPRKSLSAVLNWINQNLVTERMVQDIQEASKRIFYLVQSIKNFTHMDQGKGKERIDVHSGIDNTLTMLQYKLKKGNIEVVREFDHQLPKIMAAVGELNQVWTNLIDNALDALESVGRGRLVIRTEKDHEFVKVSIIDNGPGIPEEIKSRVFDPFFTTKDIGKGTGMGLDVVSRIINQHHGSIKVNSEPGNTVFIVCFPIAE
ncbi:MAG: cyclic nucleotide-binding domain-containing protein [Bacteroidetes bacterium]|nr:cyclic nucleotide-binding domain-containing protein [Bacteroidota bacterium]